ncbi:transposase [Mycolicibacterium fallax]|uniref:Transposase n=1 Tax=Mycolicibacterium fallax TaxID=1793 RepID=A0A1X1R304_MYCFA|nr:transposase [Mycolicibacterium fallax]
MALPHLDVARVQRWCDARVPEHALHQVRVECEVAARHLTILERRAPWREDYGPGWTSLPIARLRYTATTNTWILYWRDRNLKFHRYDLIEPTPHIEDLLTEIDRNPSGTFWG